MVVQNVKVLQLILSVLMIQISFTLPTVTSTGPGAKIRIGEDDIGKIVNIHNEFRSRENVFGNMQLMVSFQVTKNVQ